MTDEKIADICKALSNVNRLKIVKILDHGERCACEILEAFDMTQPTLSHHMNVLCDCELVNVRKEGKWSYYTLSCKVFQDFKDYIAALECCKHKKKICKNEI